MARRIEGLRNEKPNGQSERNCESTGGTEADLGKRRKTDAVKAKIQTRLRKRERDSVGLDCAKLVDWVLSHGGQLPEAMKSFSTIAGTDTSSRLGFDFSETICGAGGVGGLLWICNFQSPIGHHFAAYDGNGNVVALVSATTGGETARYEYGPFAEPIRLTGPAAALNPFRFSTKRTDSTTDLVLYEYRGYGFARGSGRSRHPTGGRAA